MLRVSLISKLRALGILGIFRLILDLIFTIITLPSARLLRRPFYVRNNGRVILGRGFTTGPGLIMDVLSKDAVLVIGKNVKFNHRAHIGVMQRIELGDNCLLASNVYISDHGHGTYRGDTQDSPFTAPNERPLFIAPVKIESNVWLGENVCVLPGVCIGEGSIIGANSVVTSNIPPHCIAAGSPARVLKVWDNERQLWSKK